MHDNIYNQIYMDFLIKSMFWISFMGLVIISILIVIDILFILFAPRVTADVVKADIAPIGKKTILIDTYGIFISYSFTYKGEIYNCQGLNSYGRVYRNGYYKALDVLNSSIDNNQIKVYIFPFNPNLSVVLPLKSLYGLKGTFLTIFSGCLASAYILGYI
ncbi:hypothetical protein [Psychrobacter sp. I-STPA6b]|uniref:hypothetical protein n=1 Tax=Psychrobacter sp. I-STPA6b TaxID=2585718 RepID=UPI001D0CD653|nr:hypothetical protein [Psychrobacter sp. I-STPA6b]